MTQKTLAFMLVLGSVLLCPALGRSQQKGGAPTKAPKSSIDTTMDAHARQMVESGRQIFRYDTFGSEAFWGEYLKSV
jgi:hypothetical protein